MNNLSVIAISAPETMTLKEITDLLDVRHNDAMKIVEKMAEDQSFGMITKISYSSPMPNGGTRSIETCQLDKRQSIAVAASLNVALLMRIVDRWQELESRQASIGYDQYAAKLLSLGLLPGIILWWETLVKRGHLYAESPKHLMTEYRPVFAQLRNSYHEWYSNERLGREKYSWSDDQFRRSLLVLTGMYRVTEICDALKRGDKNLLLGELPSIKGKVCNLPSAIVAMAGEVTYRVPDKSGEKSPAGVSWVQASDAAASLYHKAVPDHGWP